MAENLKRVKVAPKGMGLNDFVAMQEGFFAAEGLDVEFDWKTFRGTQSSWKGLDYFQRPQDRPYTEDKQDVIQGACLWGTICNASAGMGRFVTEGYGDVALGDLRAAGFQHPQAGGLERRAGLGRHARRQPFQRALPAGEISAARAHQDRQHRRLRRAAQGAARRRGRGGEPVAAADRHGRAARPAQDHRGHVPDAVVGAGAMRRPKSCAATCARSIAPRRRSTPTCRNICRCGSSRFPPEFENFHPWDFSKFGRGEQFVNETLPPREIRATCSTWSSAGASINSSRTAAPRR